ncbi:hypothetical protein OXX80_001347 [Metschnikowia pulcherrima]
MFSKFLNKQKEQGSTAFTDTSLKPTSMDDTFLNTAQAPKDEPRRRWSYVTYLDKGTLHGDGDNLMLGL